MADFPEFLAKAGIRSILTLNNVSTDHRLLTFLFRTEGIMRTCRQQASSSRDVDPTVIWMLKNRGAQSFEGLSRLTGIGWAQVFLSVDRLSRIGRVSLTPVRPCEYRISIAGLLRR